MWALFRRVDTHRYFLILGLLAALACGENDLGHGPMLVDRGLSESMFSTEGVGASDQLVPDSNLADRWQNRRVAFYLEK